MNIVYTRSNSVNPDPRVEKEVSTLLELGCSVKILAWERSGIVSNQDYITINSENIPVVKAYIRASFGGGLKNLKALFLFQLFLIKNLISIRKEIDVIHAADFDTVIPAVLMKLLFRKKVVYDIYDFYVDAFSVPSFAKKIIKYLDIKCINYVDAVILTNETRLEQIKGSSPKKICYIHNTPMESVIKSRYKNNNYLITLTYVGILQDHRLLLEIIELFKNKPDWQLIIAGFGKYEQYIRDESSNYKNIIFKGKVNYLEGLELSNQADILFATYDPKISNHKYSSANKLYEAMMLSKPIIVCKNTGMDILVKNQEIGLVIEYDIIEFENVINFVLKNRNLISSMSVKSRKVYDKSYSWLIMKEKLKNLYNELQ